MNSLKRSIKRAVSGSRCGVRGDRLLFSSPDFVQLLVLHTNDNGHRRARQYTQLGDDGADERRGSDVVGHVQNVQIGTGIVKHGVAGGQIIGIA